MLHTCFEGLSFPCRDARLLDALGDQRDNLPDEHGKVGQGQESKRAEESLARIRLHVEITVAHGGHGDVGEPKGVAVSPPH